MTPNSPRSAIGVGCRRGSKACAIESLVRYALTLAPGLRPHALYTIADKAQEPGLAEAARRLALDLIFVSRDSLRDQQTQLSIRSVHAERQFGVPSVAEAAALAGAGPSAVLIVERLAREGVTCAIAGRGVTCAITGRGVTCAITGRGVTGTITGRGVTSAVASRGVAGAVTGHRRNTA